MKKIIFITLTVLVASCTPTTQKKETPASKQTKGSIDTVKMYDLNGNYVRDTVIVNPPLN